jgi:adenine-specific DNA-methyltransferase
MGRAGAKLARLGAALDSESAQRSSGADLVAAVQACAFDRPRDPESVYRDLVPAARRKRLGQYFTPLPVAELMLRWIAEIRPRTVLDPAVGPGIFPRLLCAACPQAEVTAVDVDPVALAAARGVLGDGSRVRLVEHDFLTWPNARSFDAVIANPPYLRHHDMAYDFDVFAAVGARNGLALSRLTNLYVLFILEICRRLRSGGRAAIVVPGEWVNANFGAPLKQWLLERGWLHTLVYYSHAASVFADALTTASVLLIAKNVRAPRRIRTLYVSESVATPALETALAGGGGAPAGVVLRYFAPAELLAHDKWNDALAHGAQARPTGFVPLGALATTRRGIATGANRFFHLRPSEAQRLGLRAASVRPCVGRAADVRSCAYTEADYRALAARDARCLLLDVRGRPDARERAYLAAGERDGVAARYLCAARQPRWYRMERRPPAPIWAGVFARGGVRFSWNVDGIANLTAFHCIYPHERDPLFAAALTACLNSSVVQAQARRHLRVYGAGLSKMEPRDLLQIAVPDLRQRSPRSWRRLRDALMALDRARRAGAGVEQACARLDAEVGASSGQPPAHRARRERHA